MAKSKIECPPMINDGLEMMAMTHMMNNTGTTVDTIVILDIEFLNIRRKRIHILPLEYGEIVFRRVSRNMWYLDSSEYLVLDWRERIAKETSLRSMIRIPIVTTTEKHIGVSNETRETMLDLLREHFISVDLPSEQYKIFTGTQKRPELQRIWKMYFEDRLIKERLVLPVNFAKRKKSTALTADSTLVVVKGTQDLIALKEVGISNIKQLLDIVYLNPIFSKYIKGAKLESTYMAVYKYLQRLGWKTIESQVMLRDRSDPGNGSGNGSGKKRSDKKRSDDGSDNDPIAGSAHNPLYDALMTLGVAIALCYSSIDGFKTAIEPSV